MFDPHAILLNDGSSRLEQIETANKPDTAPQMDQLDDNCEASGASFRQWPTAQLVEYIVTQHHAYEREALRAIYDLTARVVRLHGRRQASLDGLTIAVRELIAMLIPHLEFEEQKLFPTLLANAGMGAFRSELLTMRNEHDAVFETFKRLWVIMDGFRVPDWGSDAYSALVARLECLRDDLRRHAYLEIHGLYLRYAPGYLMY